MRIDAGDDTEQLLQDVLDGLDQSIVDEMDITREFEETLGLANEPITTAVTIAVTTTSILAITRLIERWLEHRRQIDTLKIVADGFSQSDEAGKSLAGLAERHAAVSIDYGITNANGQATR